MEIKEALKVLKYYQKWRRHDGEEFLEMPNPKIIGIALDTVINFTEKEIKK